MSDPALKAAEDAYDAHVKSYRLEDHLPENPVPKPPAPDEPMNATGTGVSRMYEHALNGDWDLRGRTTAERLSCFFSFRAMNSRTYALMLRELRPLGDDLVTEFQRICRGFRDPSAEGALVARVALKEDKR